MLNFDSKLKSSEMIDHLDIKGFLTFEELQIPTLKRVNLIAGRNNSGKTALLEAIRILTAEGSSVEVSSVFNEILTSRGTLIKGLDDSYQSLQHRNISFEEVLFSINDIELLSPDFDGYRLRFTNNNKFYLSISADSSLSKQPTIFVPFQSEFIKLNELWENIALTPKEDEVIKILQESIEPNLLRFNIGQNEVKVRLNGTDSPIPLSTLGDGVKRILLIALSLANAQGKYLLIDEIELGLHHSVLETLWGIIFKYAKQWNIQVFVTTHSQDAVKTFHYVASQEKYIEDAQYIRLQHGRAGKNEAILFDGKRLQDSLELELEIR